MQTNEAAQAGDRPFDLGTIMARAIRQFAMAKNLTPLDIVEAMPVLIVQLLSESAKEDMRLVECWNCLLPFIRDQLEGVDRARALGGARKDV